MKVKYKLEDVDFYFDKMKTIALKISDPYSEMAYMKNSEYLEKKNIYLCNIIFHTSELYQCMLLYIPAEATPLQIASFKIRMNKTLNDLFVYSMRVHYADTATKEIVNNYLEEKNNYLHYREFKPITFMFDVFSQIINVKTRAFPTHQMGQLIAKFEIIANYYKFDMWEVFENHLTLNKKQ